MYTCNDCSKTFNSRMTIIRHINLHHNKQLNYIKCSFENCKLSYKTLKSFTKHLKLDHHVNIQMESFDLNSIEGKINKSYKLKIV